MDASQAMREVVESSGLTHRQIEARSRRYGGWVGQSLARPRPGADLLAEMAHACGYRLELVPMDGGRSIVIGDGCAPDRGDAPSLDQARALIARASSILEALDE